MKTQMKSSKRLFFGVGMVAVLILGIGTAAVMTFRFALPLIPRLPAPATYPTHGWTTTTPEEQGIDSAKLAEGLRAMRKNHTSIHSLLVVRYGSVVVDAYFSPYDGSTYHDMASVTKSVMTTLIGIAADQGKIDLDAPVVSYFPDRTIAHLDERKERLTVRHLAENSSGLNCTASGGEKTLQDMIASPDWVQFSLDLRMMFEPGTHFEYCSPGMHLLSSVLQEATGMTALEFARENLFAPLDIQDVYWPADPQGYTRGWGDLSLYPRDAAKIGYLFLRQGWWDGEPVVSRQWVTGATKIQTATGRDRSEDYGYGWWVSRPDSEIPFYRADGRGGQYILVVPRFDLVVVTTGGGFSLDQIDKYLVAAIDPTGKSLPANPNGVEQLNTAVAEIRQGPASSPVPSLPDIARTVSGQTYTFESNSIGLRSVRLDFDASAEATFTLDIATESAPRVSAVGLDGVYRPSRSGRPVLARGAWDAPDTFVIEYYEGPGLAKYEFILTFSGDQLSFSLDDLTIEGTVNGEQGSVISDQRSVFLSRHSSNLQQFPENPPV